MNSKLEENSDQVVDSEPSEHDNLEEDLDGSGSEDPPV